MIIIDKHNELAKFMESINFELTGLVKLDQVSFELSQSVIDELTIIHEDILSSLDAQNLAKLEELTVLLVFRGSESSKDINLLDNIIDVITPSIQKELFENKITLLLNLIKERQVLKSQLITINSELSETMGNLESELLKVKRIHESRSPRRFNDIKGIQVYSKYSAGESIGGEFFDIHVHGTEALVVMSSTSSYLASSMVLKQFADIKNDEFISKQIVLDFIDDTKSNLTELNKTKKKEIEMHLFIGIVDLNKHEIDGYVFGDFKILSSLQRTALKSSESILSADIEKSGLKKEFSREERILLCSPGFIKNWKKLSPEFMIEELMIDKKIKPIDILDEIFFQLKKNNKSSFLEFDASAIFMEVRKNAMVQV